MKALWKRQQMFHLLGCAWEVKQHIQDQKSLFMGTSEVSENIQKVQCWLNALYLNSTWFTLTQSPMQKWKELRLHRSQTGVIAGEVKLKHTSPLCNIHASKTTPLVQQCNSQEWKAMHQRNFIIGRPWKLKGCWPKGRWKNHVWLDLQPIKYYIYFIV